MSETQQQASQLNLYQKIAAITGEIGVIQKGGTNKEQGYAFIEYAAVAGELRKLFAKYRVVIVPYMGRQKDCIREEVTTKYGAKGTHALIPFTFVVINADDPKERFSVTWTGEATDYGDKATNKAATSALKYYLMRQFNVSEKGEDPDETTPEHIAPKAPRAGAKAPAQAAPSAETPKPATPTQKARLTALMRGQGVLDEDMARKLASDFGIADPKKMTYDEASNALAVLETFQEAAS